MDRHRIRRKHGNTHISLASIKQYLLHGTYPGGSTPSDKRSVRKRAESFKIENGELYYIVRPKRIEGEPVDSNPGANKANLRHAILTPKTQLAVASSVHVHHGGNHMGTERTLSALSSKYYWVGMANTVRKVVKNCVICLANRPAIATLPSTPQQTAMISQTELETSVPLSQDFVPETKREIFVETLPTVRLDEGAGDVQYIVTAEIAEPEEVDADLDFFKVMQTENEAVVDPVFSTKSDFDAAKRFWQKVEVLVLGPFQSKKKKSVFVIASMDSFSKWPEVHIVNKVNEKTVSQFCLCLIARFGVMEQIIILESEVSPDEALDPGGICQNLQAYSVAVSKESFTADDENWNLLVNNVLRFVKVYKDNWFDCLELSLIPLRNSLTQATDFTPSFVLTGREPIFPDTIIPGKDSADTEVVLSQEQIEASIDTSMAYYLQCSVPDIKQLVIPENVLDSVFQIPASRSPVRKSGRITKKYHRLADFEDTNAGDGEKDADMAHNENKKHHNGDLSLGTRKPKLTGLSTTNKKTLEADNIMKQETKDENKDTSESLIGSKEQDRNYDILEKIDLDTCYQIVSLYKTKGTYPANSSISFQSTVRNECEHYSLENGQLMYKSKGKMKKVPATLKDRLALMRDAHVTKDGHVSRTKTLETVESQNIFWKGMHIDIQAFVGACPGCKHGELRRKSRTSKRTLRWYRGAEDEENSDEETNGDLGKVTHDELIDYLKKDISPDDLSRSELLVFRKRAKNYRLVKGVLYFCPAKRKDLKPRKVLRTEKEKQEALKEAHGDQHVSDSVMKEFLKKNFFWQGINEDMDRFLVSCCQSKLTADGKADEDSDKQSPLLEAKIKLFQDYFAGKNIYSKQASLDLLFPEREEITSPLKDLVAAAMESAKLTINHENLHSREIIFTSSTVGEAMSSADVEQTLLLKPFSNQQSKDKSQNKLFYSNDVAVKKDLSDYDDNEGVDDKDMIDDDDRDETWKPSSTEDLKPSLSEMTESSKKSSIRRRCEICLEVIRGDNNFKEHMYKHTRVKPFSCAICEKKFTSIKGLKMHSRKHTGHRPYLCNICGRGFPRSASLHYHIKTHDKGGGVPVVCDVCSRVFSSESRMQKHKRFKHPLQAPVHMCELCGKIFTAKRSLKRHEEAHQGIRKYECQYCRRSFFRKEYLNYHLVSHSNEDPSLANYKMKGKLRKAGIMKKREYGTTGLSIICLEPSGVPVSQDQEAYSQLVEVAGTHDWSEGERTMVYEINGDQRAADGTLQHVTEDGTTVVLMEGQPDAHSLEVRHIILPGDHLPQHHNKPAKQITMHHQQHPEMGQSQSIEVTLPTGLHTFTLPSGGQLHATEADNDTVHYQVECLPGETLTEDDFNAIRVLAQASLGGTHLIHQ